MILVMGIMVVLWLVASHLEMQRALQWWFWRQSVQMMDQSEQIHNGVLQDLFAVRRSLEVASAERSISATQSQAWLNQAERIHHALEQISNFLTPPYLSESLSLALQTRLKDWQQDHPTWTVSWTFNEMPKTLNQTPHETSNQIGQGNLSQPWTNTAPEQNRIILEVLGEFFCLASPIALAAGSLNLQIDRQGNWNELIIQIGYPSESSLNTIMQTRELKYLRRVFQGLTGGRCFYVKHNLNVTWHFCWKLKV